MLTDLMFQVILTPSPKQFKKMPTENRDRDFEVKVPNVPFVPFKKCLRIKTSNRIFRVEAETMDEVFLTELDKNTGNPIGKAPSAIAKRKYLEENSEGFPYMDKDFLQDLWISRVVRNLATNETYTLVKFEEELRKSVIKDSSGNEIRIPTETLYGNYEVVKSDVVCKICNITKVIADKTVN